MPMHWVYYLVTITTHYCVNLMAVSVCNRSALLRNINCLLNILLRFGAILQMAPKNPLYKRSGDSRERLARRLRRRGATPAGSDEATSNTPTGPDGIGSTAYVTPEATLADTIATAVLRQSGRLLPTRAAMPSTSTVADVVSYGDSSSAHMPAFHIIHSETIE